MDNSQITKRRDGQPKTMFKGLFTTDYTPAKTVGGKQQSNKKRAQQYRNLIRKEAELGGTVFGPIPSGVRREFFCLDERTWVWHEEWTDKLNKKHIQTTRYDVRPDGIVKCQNDGPYIKVSPQELENLHTATQRYYNLISQNLYSQNQT